MPSLRAQLIKHRELLRFAIVGGISFAITTAINYALKLTVLTDKPTVALAIGVLVATIFSYVASREFAFDTRGGRESRHEAAVFFIISAISLGLNALPLFLARNLFHIHTPNVSLVFQETSDFVCGMILGTLLGTVFRFWALRKWAFPEADARPRVVRGGKRALPDIPGEKAA